MFLSMSVRDVLSASRDGSPIDGYRQHGTDSE
jgi:hypothetical protein